MLKIHNEGQFIMQTTLLQVKLHRRNDLKYEFIHMVIVNSFIYLRNGKS